MAKGFAIINLRNSNHMFLKSSLKFAQHELGYYVALIDGVQIDQDNKLEDLAQRIADKAIAALIQQGQK